jgi:hypothetical protein
MKEIIRIWNDLKPEDVLGGVLLIVIMLIILNL